MATSAGPKINVTQSELTMKEQARQQWVIKVDDYITVESLDIMKLSVRSELTETECDKIKAASDVYRELAKHYTDPEVLLARFIYALEKLGHRRYGYRAIRELKECYRPSPFNFTKLSEKTDKNDFILRQRLALLCCMLPEDYSVNFIHHLAKKMQANPQIFKTPCQILKIAVEKSIITPDSHVNEIEEALIQANLPEVKIQELVANYNKIAAGLESTRTSATSDSSPERSPTNRLRAPRSSFDHDHSSDSSSPMPNSTSSSESVKHSSSDEVTSGSSSPVEIHRQPTEATETTPLLQGQRDQQTGNANGTEQEAPANDDRIVNKKKKCLILTGLLVCCISVIMMLGAATLTGFFVKHYQSNQPTTKRYHQNSSVILTELNHFFNEYLVVTEDTEHLGDIHHDIIVYQAESQCRDLENRIVYAVNGSDNSPTSTPMFYALAGSSIALSICGFTNLTVHSKRLEIVLMKGLDDVDNPYITKVPYKVNFFDPGLDGELKCKNMKFNLQTNNYYSLSFLVPPTSMSFQYELTYNISVIDPNLLAEQATANRSLHADQDDYKFTLSEGIQVSCFVAIIRENPIALNGDVHIQLSYGNRPALLTVGLVGLTVGLVGLTTGLVLFLAVLLIAYRCKKRV